MRAFARKTVPGSRESGQAMLVFLLVLGLFLLAAIGFAVDMSSMWFHRQTAQNAADAACTAAAMDMLSIANGGTPAAGFTPGTNFQCSSASSAAPCRYAALNGYTASALTANTPGVDLNISFPGSVSGVPSCSGTPTPSVCATPAAVSARPYVQVNVTDRVQTFFSGLVRGSSTMDVGAQASCGLVLSNAPIPILVLNPTANGTLSGNGNFDIKIDGGPQRSIQVNSSSATAVSISGGSGSIDLRTGGPSRSGSDFAVTGSEAQVGVATLGTTGHWLAPTSPISDPFAQLPAPAQPGLPAVPADVAGIATCNTSAKIAGGSCQVPLGTHGCPATKCMLYAGGFYAGGITVKGNETAIFDPGLYYVNSGLALNSLSCVRPSTALGDGTGGTMFYFADTNSVSVAANSGSTCSATPVPLSVVRCTPASSLPTNLPGAGLTGNVLLGPCSGPYGDPLGTSDPVGEQRGIVFFQNRSASGVSAEWGGGGAFGLVGTMYFHYCNSADGVGKGTNCNASAYNDTFSFQGGSSSASFVVGNVVTDKLDLGGNPALTMDLNPNALYYTLKATLIQ